jgi:hypothetical protein
VPCVGQGAPDDRIGVLCITYMTCRVFFGCLLRCLRGVGAHVGAQMVDGANLDDGFTPVVRQSKGGGKHLQVRLSSIGWTRCGSFAPHSGRSTFGWVFPKEVARFAKAGWPGSGW